jgi:hypothetical protein
VTIHKNMFDGKEKKERTYHRVYVEFEGGYFISLGVSDPAFQQMVQEHGGPNTVEFRDTGEKWNIDDDERPGSAGV